MSRGGRDDVNTTRQNSKAQNVAKVQRDCAKHTRDWQKREEERRRKAAKHEPTLPAVRRSGDGPVDSTSTPAASA
jgi:hypothetical protein